MNLLLDTHALIWWLAGDDALGAQARALIEVEDTQVFVSAASAMEISTKHRLGKLAGAGLLATNLSHFLSDQGFVELPISIAHAAMAGNLQIAHKDPFDRFLIAQSLFKPERKVVHSIVTKKAFGNLMIGPSALLPYRLP